VLEFAKPAKRCGSSICVYCGLTVNESVIETPAPVDTQYTHASRRGRSACCGQARHAQHRTLDPLGRVSNGGMPALRRCIGRGSSRGPRQSTGRRWRAEWPGRCRRASGPQMSRHRGAACDGVAGTPHARGVVQRAGKRGWSHRCAPRARVGWFRPGNGRGEVRVGAPCARGGGPLQRMGRAAVIPCSPRSRGWVVRCGGRSSRRACRCSPRSRGGPERRPRPTATRSPRRFSDPSGTGTTGCGDGSRTPAARSRSRTGGRPR
jgi:hypothetical protein